MYEKLETCPVCKSKDIQNYLICTDHSVSKESFALTKCNKCGLVFTNPRPEETVLPKYYDSNNYISHTNKGNNPINLIYKLVRKYTLHKKYQLLKKYAKGKSLLDYGCGTGDFLVYAKKKGLEVNGFEPSESVQKILKERNIELISNLKNQIQYDFITAWHVIEHLPELRKTVKALKKKLSDKGIMFIAVPNIASFDCQHYGEHWAAYDVPRHLYHFDQNSFGKLIAETKLKLIDTIPMKFDSFYVSMLSEKYLNGENNYLKAFNIGKKSNKKATKTGDYSSLIYVLKK